MRAAGSHLARLVSDLDALGAAPASWHDAD